MPHWYCWTALELLVRDKAFTADEDRSFRLYVSFAHYWFAGSYAGYARSRAARAADEGCKQVRSILHIECTRSDGRRGGACVGSSDGDLDPRSGAFRT